MPWHVLALVLVAAVMHATWNAFVKGSGDRFASFMLVLVTGTILGIPFVPFVGFPHADAWPWLIASVIVHGIYYVGLLSAYAEGDLGHVYPIARGSAPLLVALASTFGAAELLSWRELTGVGIVTAGIFALAGFATTRETRARRATWWALGTAVTIAAYTICDGLGGRRSGDTIGYIVWLNICETPLAIAVYLVLRRKRAFALGRRDVLQGMAGGVIATLGYGIAIWAMSVTALAHVAALRETSVVFAAVLGTYMLKERFGARRIAATIIVAAGIVLMNT